MRYMGGKSRIAKHLAEAIDRVRKPGQLVWDPFCGGLSMAVALSKNGPVWATDVNAALINLYKAVQSGWSPPTEVSKDVYQAAKSLPDTDPMKAFCGFGCSFGSKWFGGYVGNSDTVVTVDHPRSSARKGSTIRSRPAASTAAKLRKDVPSVTRLDCGDFLSVQPQPLDAVLYLDPPYRGTTSYAGAPPFDHDLFIQRVRDWAGYTHVFISEYDFPIGRVVWQKAAPESSCFTGHTTVERLYYLGPNQ